MSIEEHAASAPQAHGAANAAQTHDAANAAPAHGAANAQVFPGLDRATIDALAANLCVIDATGRIVAVNRAWREFAAANGAQPEQVGDAQNYLNICDAVRESCDVAGTAADGIRAVLRGEVGEFSLEYPCHAPDVERWFAMRVTRRTLFGAPAAVIIHTDVTERWLASRALRAERDFVATVLETTSALILVLDRDARVLRFNRACEAASGYRSQEVQGRGIWELGLVPDEELAEVRRAAGEVFSGRGPVSIQNRWRHRDGTQRLLAWTGSASLDARGEIEYIVASAIDVTAAHAATAREQERLDELARLHRLHTAGGLATTLAHELSQPLAAIANFAEAAKLQIAAEELDCARLSGLVERIAEQALRAGRTIRELRAFLARSPRDSAGAHPNAVARSAQELTAPYARARNVEVRLVLAEDADEVVGGALGLEHILVNLLRNAVEAIAEANMKSGSITLRTFRVDGFVRISVEDSGPGLDIDTASKVFTPFFTTKPNGIGLGLHISRTLAEAAGGRLWAEPHAPGARFHLELPLAQ